MLDVMAQKSNPLGAQVPPLLGEVVQDRPRLPDTGTQTEAGPQKEEFPCMSPHASRRTVQHKWRILPPKPERMQQATTLMPHNWAGQIDGPTKDCTWLSPNRMASPRGKREGKKGLGAGGYKGGIGGSGGDVGRERESPGLVVEEEEGTWGNAQEEWENTRLRQ